MSKEFNWDDFKSVNDPVADNSISLPQEQVQQEEPGLMSKWTDALSSTVKEGKINPTELIPSALSKFTNKKPTAQDAKKSLEALSSGIATGSTFGMGDEGSSAITAGLDVTLDNSPSIEGETKKQKYDRLYKEYLKNIRQTQAKAEQQDPAAFLAGDLMSSVASPLPLMGAAKLTGKGLQNYDKLGRLGKTGVILGEGMAQGYGRSEAEDATQDALIGGALGLGGAVAAKGLAKGVEQIRKRGDVADIQQVANELLGDTANQSLRAVGGDVDDFRKVLETTTKNKLAGTDLVPQDYTGVVGVKEGIISPLLKPEQSFQKAKEFKTRIGKNYEQEFDKLKGYAVKDPGEAVAIADDLHQQIYQQIDDFAKTDLKMTEDQKVKLLKRADELKEDIQMSFLSDNPLKELQNIYVKYNKDAFSNRAAGDVAKVLRNAVKGKQRQLISELEPDSAQKFMTLDKEYSSALDLENLTEEFAAKAQQKGTKFSIGDWVSSGILSSVTEVPGLGLGYLGASKAVKSTLGKDITDIIPAYGAQNKLQDYNKLMERFTNLKDKGSERTVVSGAIKKTQEALKPLGPAGLVGGRIGSVLGKQYTPIADSSSEELIQKANDIVATNPSKGNQLVAEKLNKAASSDNVGKAAQQFDLMQRQEGRKALEQKEDEEFNWDDY